MTPVQYSVGSMWIIFLIFLSQIICIKAVQCPDPNVDNAVKLSGYMGPYSINSVVRFQCKKQYKLIGSDTVKCNQSSKWDPELPKCLGICTFPTHLPFAELEVPTTQSIFLEGTQLKYKCKQGFEHVPGTVDTVTCSKLQWSPFQLFCNSRTCANPGYLENGWYSPHLDKYIYNDTITYFCDEGFQLIGKASITCGLEERWSNNPPRCRGKPCGCPPTVSNAVLEVKDFLFESKAVYTCEKGYKMVSPGNSLICGPNGEWTGTLSVCEVQNCLPPEDPVDGSYSPKKNEYSYNETVIYKCNTLQLVGNASVSCTDEGKWSSGAPQCRAVCTFPPKLDFAVEEEEEEIIDMGKSIQYKCRAGFVPVTGKNNKLTCLESLKWSQHELFCTPISCGDPGDIDHGQMQSEDFFFGSRVYYTCNPGYSMISKRNYRECQADGTWTGKPPVCKEPVCDQIWELQEEARKCTSTPDEWIKYLQVQYLYLQIENLKLDNEIKKRQLSSTSEPNLKSEE